MQRGQVTAKVTIKVFLMQLCPFSSENFHRKSNNHTPVFALLCPVRLGSTKKRMLLTEEIGIEKSVERISGIRTIQNGGRGIN